MSSKIRHKFDWQRIEKALAVEKEYGYQNIKGKQYRFSEFLCLTFGSVPPVTNLLVAFRWQNTAKQFARYQKLSEQERIDLLTETETLLAEVQDIEKNQPPVVKESQPENHLAPSTTPKTNPVAKTVQKISKFYLNDPVTYLDAIALRKKDLLLKLGIKTIRDLLFYYPRDHIDYARQVNIKDLNAGETVTIIGKVKKVGCFSSPKNKKLTIFNLTVQDRTGELKITRFYAGNFFSNRGWQEKMKRMYPRFALIAASGLVKENKYGITLDNPEFEVLDSNGDNSINSFKIGRLLPVYPLTDGIPADVIRKAVQEALPTLEQIEDPLPPIIKQQYSLIDLQTAIAHIHYPEEQQQLIEARRRLIFDEFFYLQLGFLQRKQQEKANRVAVSFAPQGQLIEQFQEILPFSLTNAQQRVIQEIQTDLQSSSAMNRLVQGDVGSGKTIVAVFAILAALQSGYQAALMAPTEVLAEQHYRKIVGWFNQLYLPVELLTGSTKTAKRREIHAQLQSGELPLLIGTHALIQDPVQFRKLGLVVIDEQHRFGVHQRGKLLSKGEAPHVLSMTATPIPRTLALTLHGDLDVSQIDELPPGRQEIKTSVLTGKGRLQSYELIKREVAKGRQAYVIFPLVEESEKLDVKAAVAEHKRFSEKIFPDFNVGLLHGRMSSEEKDKALTAFRDNETQIIVSTTVIEVGVDVPNATVMLIENSERFGLSQLHQLRGRVGRGNHKSFCVLISGHKNPDGIQRLKVLEQSTDGFFIAEMDLNLRGPGEVLGSRQSGLPDFALASLVEDQDVLILAREAAEKILLQAQHLEEGSMLKEELARRYQKLIGSQVLM